MERFVRRGRDGRILGVDEFQVAKLGSPGWYPLSFMLVLGSLIKGCPYSNMAGYQGKPCWPERRRS